MSPRSAVERLSRKQRELSPPEFARYLVARVRQVYRCHTVSALWVRHDTPYCDIDGVECWDALRNARHYHGPHPVICHPPCGPCGKYASRCKQPMLDGIRAMHIVHCFGGVVEQPDSSSLFARHGEPFAHELQRLHQCDYGHCCLKPTLLYWVLPSYLERRLCGRSR